MNEQVFRKIFPDEFNDKYLEGYSRIDGRSLL